MFQILFFTHICIYLTNLVDIFSKTSGEGTYIMQETVLSAELEPVEDRKFVAIESVDPASLWGVDVGSRWIADVLP